MDLICDWLQDKDLQFIQSEALHVRNMLYSGIFEVFVPKKGQQSGWKWNIAPKQLTKSIVRNH